MESHSPSDEDKEIETCSSEETCGNPSLPLLDSPKTLRVMTYNIRFDQLNPRPNLPLLNWTNEDPNPWLDRREKVCDVIRNKSPDFMGVQEAKAWQAIDISCLTGMSWIGDGRDVPHSSTNNFYQSSYIQAALIGTILVVGLILRFFVRKLRVGVTTSIGKATKKLFWVVYTILGIFFCTDIVVKTFLFDVKSCSRSLAFFWGGPITAITAVSIQTVAVAITPRFKTHAIISALIVRVLVIAVVVPFLFADEFSAIYFNETSLGYVGEAKTTWLNDNNEPGRIASEWGSGCTRIATHALFRDFATNKIFRYVNTHLDHVSEGARRGGATAVTEIYKGDNRSIPTILTGDMNSYAGDAAWYTFNSSGLGDSYFLSREEFVGPMKSYNAFSEWEECGRFIDFVWVDREVFKVHSFKSEFYKGQISDHNPVWVDLSWYTKGEPVVRENYRRRIHNCRPRF